MSAGLGATGMNAIGRAVVGSVITQGIGVVTGMQQEFSWSGVAAAGVGAGVGQAVGNAVFGDNKFAQDLTVGLASSVARQMVSGGKVNWANVAADAFGNAIGNSQGYRATAVGNAEQVGVLEGAMAGASSGPDYAEYHFDDWASPVASTDPVFVDSDNYDLMGTRPGVGVAGKDARQGAWGIAKSLTRPDASNGEINRVKNQLLTLNPELASGVRAGQRYYTPDADTPENLALAKSADGAYDAQRAAQAATAAASAPAWSFREASMAQRQMDDARINNQFFSAVGSYASSTSSFDRLVGSAELLLAGASRVGAGLAGGLTYLGTLAWSGDSAAAADVKLQTEDVLSYQLRSNGGMQVANTLGAALAPAATLIAERYGNFKQGLGDFGYAAGGPFLGAIAATAPDAALEFLRPAKALEGILGAEARAVANTAGKVSNPAIEARLDAFKAWKESAGVDGTPTSAEFRRFMGAHRPNSRGETLYDANTSGFADWSRRVDSIHGNTAGSQPTWLYKLESADRGFLKWGISQDPFTRYSGPFMRDKIITPLQQGPRRDILKVERNLVETQPGPLNHEPWRGSRQGTP